MSIKSYLETKYGLLRNPFPGNATYGEDSQLVYVPEMFGEQRKEFLRKFILAPLENGQPLIGAVWSVVPGDPEAATLLTIGLGRVTHGNMPVSRSICPPLMGITFLLAGAENVLRFP